ncbi:Oidioi.mRNA.OKI2018_I69.chr2.g4483.t1.cds [Oikopleura dioica]|uniref:Oidioi.mRNA.OKI2018_I69.chr2.g4483.t1.cds n=1 Tax=Oikopleura dioica TaxID=34765 RepID=A0ABN7SX77_OIKDI|nr:Oidioi.mRNA.OKI2018_I69.chr2.g4483.t1.cds [Oikopleura dioica]
MQKTIEKCSFFMEFALLCPTAPLKKTGLLEQPTSLWFVRGGLIRKYTHRLSQVFLDAIHHIEQKKCTLIPAQLKEIEERNGFEEVLGQIQRQQFLKTNVPKNIVEEMGNFCLQDVRKLLDESSIKTAENAAPGFAVLLT